MMDRKDIEVFNAIVTEKNLTRAANALYLSPSTLGSRLKSLENSLGVELIERAKGKKTVQLTRYGEEFIKIARNMEALYKESDQLSGELKDISLIVGTVDGLLNHNLVPFYEKLMEKPDLFHLDLQLYPSDQIYPMVSNQEIDVGFIAYKMSFSNVVVEEIYSDDIVVVTPTDFPIKKRTVHPTELNPAEELLIGSKTNPHVGWGALFNAWHAEWFDEDVEPLLTTNTISAVSYFLKSASFWTLMPRTTANGFSKEMPLKIYDLEIPAPKRTAYMLTNKNQSNYMTKVIDLFRKELFSYTKNYLPNENKR